MRNWKHFYFFLALLFIFALSLVLIQNVHAQSFYTSNSSRNSLCGKINFEDLKSKAKSINSDLGLLKIKTKTPVIPDGEDVEIDISRVFNEGSILCAKISGLREDIEILDVDRSLDEKITVTLEIPNIGWRLFGKKYKLEIAFLPFDKENKEFQPDAQNIYYISRDIIISSWLFSFIGSVIFVIVIYTFTAIVASPENSSQSSSRSFLEIFNFRKLDPIVVTSGKFGKASLVNLQVMWFTLIVLGLLVHVLLRTGALSPISEDILLLLGISAASKTFSVSIDTAKNRLSSENWSWLLNQGWIQDYDRMNTARWRDLVITNDGFDVYRYQLLVFSFLVGLTLTVSGLDVLGTFRLPSGFLSLLGLSNVVYIFGMTVSQNSISELNEHINLLRDLAKNYQKDPDEYLYKARNVARMLISICGKEVTKFKSGIKDKDLEPILEPILI